jgi:hypothetical protein
VDEEEVVSSQYELDMRLQAEIAAKNLRNTGSSGFLQSPIACPINAEKFDNERDVNDEEYPEEEVDFSCSEDPDQFARAVGLSTHKIREIDKEIAMEEENKENRNPGVMEVVGQKKQTLGGCNAKAVNNIQFEAQERIRKAKAKAEIDDALRRRSVRNKKNDDQHAMDKCEDMAKKKNLETVPGNEDFPTVLNTDYSYLSHITKCIGVSLGKTDEEAEKTASMIKQLEVARCNLYLADLRKVKDNKLDSGSKLDSFDPSAVRDLHSDDDDEESLNDEDADLDATIKLLASLHRNRSYRAPPSAFSVGPKVRIRTG